MDQKFIVQHWCVWPPIEATDEEITSQQNALLSSIPKLLKRRLSPLARTVFCAAIPCIQGNKDMPTVFSSTHGELAKSFKMMAMIEQGEEVSPTSFSLSVHNAIAGLFSMAFHNKQQSTVVAPGEEGISAAFIEALGLLQEGTQEVLIVFYDEPLVAFYPSAPYRLSTDTRCAIALNIRLTGSGISLRLSNQQQVGDDGEQPLHIPRLIQFLSTDDKKLVIQLPRHSWCWEKK